MVKKDNRTWDGRPLHEHLREQRLWGKIHRAARTNAALQHMLDQVVLFYKLSETNAASQSQSQNKSSQ